MCERECERERDGVTRSVTDRVGVGVSGSVADREEWDHDSVRVYELEWVGVHGRVWLRDRARERERDRERVSVG